MAEGTKSTILIAIISSISAIVVAVITTYGTIAVSSPAVKRVKKEIDSQQIMNLPIGTIVPSMLQPTEFAKEVGDLDRKTIEWVLADGKKDITNSLYGQLSGNTRPPDLRGMFLRGMNEGRKDGDPDENRKPGDEQDDMFEEHKHDMVNVVYADNTLDKKHWVAHSEYFAYGYKPSSQTKSFGGVETRPRNVAVYFYIKIN